MWIGWTDEFGREVKKGENRARSGLKAPLTSKDRCSESDYMRKLRDDG